MSAAARTVAIIPLVGFGFHADDGHSYALRPGKVAVVDRRFAKQICDGERARYATDAEAEGGNAIVDAAAIIAEAQAEAVRIIAEAQGAPLVVTLDAEPVLDLLVDALGAAAEAGLISQDQAAAVAAFIGTKEADDASSDPNDGGPTAPGAEPSGDTQQVEGAGDGAATTQGDGS